MSDPQHRLLYLSGSSVIDASVDALFDGDEFTVVRREPVPDFETMASVLGAAAESSIVVVDEEDVDTLQTIEVEVETSIDVVVLGDRVCEDERFTYYNVSIDDVRRARQILRLLVQNQGIRQEMRQSSEAVLEESSDEIEFVSLHDSLTGLPNRQSLLDRLDVQLQQQTFDFGCVIVNVDRFKVLNDRFGASAGDLIIVEMAKRLSRIVRQRDVVCRVAGDEFTIICSVTNENQLRQVADRIHTSLTTPIQFDSERQINLRVSLGAVIAAPAHQSPEGMLRDASVALSRAKKRGGNSVEFFDPENHQRDLDHLEIETDLSRGLDLDEFKLAYQPVVSLTDSSVLGFEALLRWTHNIRGPISPGVFIPIAEQSGFIDRLGIFVLVRACKQLKIWTEEFPDRTFFIAINISRRQLLQRSFADRALRIIDEHGVDPTNLHFEITETAVIDSIDVVAQNLKALRTRGVQICIDDFGVGYSSLSSLYRLPVDVLKIDRSFIQRIGVEEDGAKLVQAVIDISRALGLHLVAEGIETAEQAKELLTAGCDVGQGFYYSKGIDADSATEMLRAPRH